MTCGGAVNGGEPVGIRRNEGVATGMARCVRSARVTVRPVPPSHEWDGSGRVVPGVTLGVKWSWCEGQ